MQGLVTVSAVAVFSWVYLTRVFFFFLQSSFSFLSTEKDLKATEEFFRVRSTWL
jgi:hypothetical protein